LEVVVVAVGQMAQLLAELELMTMTSPKYSLETRQMSSTGECCSRQLLSYEFASRRLGVRSTAATIASPNSRGFGPFFK
jgi:hypothetical protein